MPSALVTGASRGIGLEVAGQLAASGWTVFCGVRDPARAGEVPGGHVEKLDMADPGSISACVERLRAQGAPLDLVVNNAGVYQAGIAQVWATNLRGPIQLVRELRAASLLPPKARVVNVSSGLGALSCQPPELQRRLSDPAPRIDALLALSEEKPGWYGATKAALNAFTRALIAEGVLATSVDPGWVRTEMGGPGAPRSLAQGAASVTWACRLPPEERAAGFYRDGREIPW